MFTYICPINCNVKILNGRKAPAKGVRLIIIKTPKIYNYYTLNNILYATKSTTYNNLNRTQALQPFQNHSNRSTMMVGIHKRLRKENKTLNRLKM